MIQIDYDILFTLGASLLTGTSNVSTKIDPGGWLISPSPQTRELMRKRKMLFRKSQGMGLVIAEPIGYVKDDQGKEVAEFAFQNPLRFWFEVRHRQLQRDPEILDLYDQEKKIPLDKKAFLELLFPNRKPVYVLSSDRLKIGEKVGDEDMVAPPVNRLAFEKSMYPEVTLTGPIPGGENVSPSHVVIYEDGEEKIVEDPFTYEYALEELPEGRYELVGKQNRSGLPTKDFSGILFLYRGRIPDPPLVYVSVDISVGTYRANKQPYTVKFGEA